MKTIEEFLKEQGFHYKFYYEINENEVMISNFQNGLFIREDMVDIYVLRINQERTKYSPVMIFQVPETTKILDVMKQPDMHANQDLLFINAKDKDGKAIYSLIYNKFSREIFYDGVVKKFYLSDEDFDDELCYPEEANFVQRANIFCNRDIIIGKLDMLNTTDFGYTDYALGSYAVEKDRENAKKLISAKVISANIDYEYYVLMTTNGVVVMVFASFEELKDYLLENDNTLFLSLINTRKLEFINECDKITGIHKSSEELEKFVTGIKNRYAKNQAQGSVIKLMKHFNL